MANIVMGYRLPPPALGTNVFAGAVSGTWDYAGSPYRVYGNITVDSGTTLTIEPGVKVEFQGRYSMRVRGGVSAVGTDMGSGRIQFTTTPSDISQGDWNWIGWRGISIVGCPDYPPDHDHGVGKYDFRFCEIAYVDKATGIPSNVDPHDEWNGNFLALNVYPEDIVFNDNWVHHAAMKKDTSNGGTGGGVLFWVSHTIEPNDKALDYYFYRNVFEDSQWNGAYFAHNRRTNGTMMTAHLVDGAFRRTQKQPAGSASVCTVFATNASLEGVEITDCGNETTTPWFAETGGSGNITYTAP
jgi:hypothetical protein